MFQILALFEYSFEAMYHRFAHMLQAQNFFDIKKKFRLD